MCETPDLKTIPKILKCFQFNTEAKTLQNPSTEAEILNLTKTTLKHYKAFKPKPKFQIPETHQAKHGFQDFLKWSMQHANTKKSYIKENNQNLRN